MQKKLNLGCGYKKDDDEIGIDIIKTPVVDVIADAHHLPFKDNSFDLVIASHVLEHLDFIKSLDEIHRVLKNKGKLKAKVPHALSPWFFDNPLHRTHYTIWSLKYYTDWNEFQRAGRFKLLDMRLNGRFASIFNLKLEKFEKLIRLLPFNYELEFELEAVKCSSAASS